MENVNQADCVRNGEDLHRVEDKQNEGQTSGSQLAQILTSKAHF